MSRYMLVGDIHLSDVSPSMCVDSYTDDLFTILEHTIQLEIDLQVDGVIWSGDVFHRRQANRNSHKLVQRAIDIVQSYKKLWIVPGNHDYANGDRFESIFETQPLGVLFKAGAELLSGWDSSGFHAIYGIPWQQKWTEEGLRKLFEDWHDNSLAISQQKNSLVIAHAPLYPPGQELEWENFPAQKWSEVQGAGYVYYGHVHDYHGVFQVGDVTFCNQGAITRGSLQESDLNRKIAVTTWSPDEGFVRVDVPHKDSSQVFKLVEKREEQAKKIELEEFLESVGSVTLDVTSIESVINYIRSMDLPEDVKALCVELLEAK